MTDDWKEAQYRTNPRDAYREGYRDGYRDAPGSRGRPRHDPHRPYDPYYPPHPGYGRGHRQDDLDSSLEPNSSDRLQRRLDRREEFDEILRRNQFDRSTRCLPGQDMDECAERLFDKPHPDIFPDGCNPRNGRGCKR